jgi:hypothetical protein
VAGDDFDYFRAGNNTTFGYSTTPGSKSYSGYNLSRFLRNISAPGPTMSFDLEGTDPSNLGMGIKAYPNPCYLNKPPFKVIIAGIPLDASEPKIYIYNTAGELVRTLVKGDGITDPENNGAWDGKNQGGRKAASGIYLYVVRTANFGRASGSFYILW